MFGQDFFNDEVFDYTDDSVFENWARRSVLSLAVKEGKTDSENPEKSTRSLLSLGWSASLLNSSDPLHVFFDKSQSKVYNACRIAYSSRLTNYMVLDMTYTEVGKRVSDMFAAASRGFNLSDDEKASS